MIHTFVKAQPQKHWLTLLLGIVLLVAFMLPLGMVSAVGPNLALNRPAVASSIEGTGFEAVKAVDGNATSTRWASVEPATTAQWIYVDLGSTSSIGEVILKWEVAYGKSYQIQTSNDAVNWTSIYSTTTGDGATDDLMVSGSGRYVRVYMTVRGTSYGYSLWELEVYGAAGVTATNTITGSTATKTNTPVILTATRTPTPVILTATKTRTRTPTATSVAGTWNLVWSDEFAGTTINTSNWSFVVNGDGGGNNERQYYTNGNNASLISDASAQDGKALVLEARKENPSNYQCWYGTCQYTSARMVTEGKKSWLYGKIVARMKLPYGRGMWPAFWMLGGSANNWPTVGEIDIMELVGGAPFSGCSDCGDDKASGDMWFGSGAGSDIGDQPYPALPAGQKYADAYHEFGIEWNAQSVSWSLDGTILHTHDITPSQFNAFRTNYFHILLNIAVGGDWPTDPDSTTVWPQRMYVDWVRVYQK